MRAASSGCGMPPVCQIRRQLPLRPHPHAPPPSNGAGPHPPLPPLPPNGAGPHPTLPPRPPNDAGPRPHAPTPPPHPRRGKSPPQGGGGGRVRGRGRTGLEPQLKVGASPGLPGLPLVGGLAVVPDSAPLRDDLVRAHGCPGPRTRPRLRELTPPPARVRPGFKKACNPRGLPSRRETPGPPVRAAGGFLRGPYWPRTIGRNTGKTWRNRDPPPWGGAALGATGVRGPASRVDSRGGRSIGRSDRPLDPRGRRGARRRPGPARHTGPRGAGRGARGSSGWPAAGGGRLDRIGPRGALRRG